MTRRHLYRLEAPGHWLHGEQLAVRAPDEATARLYLGQQVAWLSGDNGPTGWTAELVSADDESADAVA